MPRRRLAFAVHLEDPATGDRLVLLPDEIPARELAELITHPGAWHPDDDRDVDDPDDDGDDPATSDGHPADDEEDEPASDGDGPPAPKAARTRKTRATATE
ncbi:hypothetical protein [Kitasatospora purpeofusca]|uniref:hypothetical protein n=1 Tax=Kitasatospora purpeofusca TaxID=67352 RepID=UPI002A5A39D5|nr:hypothetical protein [Kitasatospora purpeofusca]MDY0816089.1 hypothetical protein [Kitasatospora purpeofusca]